jgi:hypothetical protein
MTLSPIAPSFPKEMKVLPKSVPPVFAVKRCHHSAMSARKSAAMIDAICGHLDAILAPFIFDCFGKKCILIL